MPEEATTNPTFVEFAEVARAIDIMRGSGEDTAGYAVGWTVSGLATLATIVVVWVFAI